LTLLVPASKSPTLLLLHWRKAPSAGRDLRLLLSEPSLLMGLLLEPRRSLISHNTRESLLTLNLEVLNPWLLHLHRRLSRPVNILELLSIGILRSWSWNSKMVASLPSLLHLHVMHLLALIALCHSHRIIRIIIIRIACIRGLLCAWRRRLGVALLLMGRVRRVDRGVVGEKEGRCKR